MNLKSIITTTTLALTLGLTSTALAKTAVGPEQPQVKASYGF